MVAGPHVNAQITSQIITLIPTPRTTKADLLGTQFDSTSLKCVAFELFLYSRPLAGLMAGSEVSSNWLNP
jgi:hypothetical protein